MLEPLFVLRAGNVPDTFDPFWNPDNLTVLEVEARVDQPLLTRVKVGDTWRTNRNFDTLCQEHKVPLIYIGWLHPITGWNFRWKCPECGRESETMFPGYRPPRPDLPFGGNQKKTTASRRERAGY